MTNLAERMMLVSLHISVYAGAKVDAKVSHDVVSLAGAARKSGKFTKNLFADALEPIHKAAKAARNEHDQMTLPWRHGQDCLPAGVFLKYMEAQRLNKSIFDREVSLFLDCYQDHIDHAQQRLGRLFNPGDYPDKDTLRARFEFDIEVSPLPSVGDFRVELVDDDRAEIVADLEKRIQDRVDQGRTVLAERIKSCLERMKAGIAEMTGAGSRRSGHLRLVRRNGRPVPVPVRAADAAAK